MKYYLNRKSPNYQATLDANCSSDLQWLKEFRKQVSKKNRLNRKLNKNDQPQLYVAVRGRKPKVKKEVYNWYTNETKVLSYNFGGMIVGGLKNANVFDVYVYAR